MLSRSPLVQSPWLKTFYNLKLLGLKIWDKLPIYLKPLNSLD